MGSLNPAPPAAPPEPPPGDRLNSWKEIAAYLKRDVRTLHRWEAEEGLPIRRHLHKKRGSVYAYMSELEAWWDERRLHLEKQVAAPASHWDWRKIALVSIVLLLILGPSVYLVQQRAGFHAKVPDRKIILAVLPFENLGGDPDQEYFSDGMTEEMITQLGGLEPQRLGVIARASAMQYKHSTKSAAQIGRELGVDYLLEGSARRADGRVRITAQLIQVRDQTHLWAASYERDLSDLLVLQNEVATAIAQQIQVQFTTQTQAALARARLVDEASQDAYLRGTFFLEKDTVDSLKKSIKYFQQAIDQDPGYAMPYVGLAKAYGLLANLTAVPPGEAYPNSRAAATKALEIDETISEAHTQLAWTKFLYDRDWAGAERSFRRALALNPSNATAHEGYAMYSVAIGQPTEALAEIRRAEKLDPLSLLIKADKGCILYYARQPDEAINELLETIDMDPNFAITHFFLGQAYELKGMFSQAIAEFQKAITLSGGSRPSGTLGHVYAVSGKKGKALKVVGEQERRSRRQYVSPYDIALVYGALGDSDRAFAWLERAYQDRYWMMAFLKVDPRLDPVRSDPRYTDLLRRSGLVP